MLLQVKVGGTCEKNLCDTAIIKIAIAVDLIAFTEQNEDRGGVFVIFMRMIWYNEFKGII
jgi:hypothetical protein